MGCDQSSTLPKESLEILAGLNPDGSRDRAFQPPLFRPAAGSTTATLRALAIDDRGFILAGGDFEFGESSRTNHNLLRLRPDGVPDTNWNIGSGANGSVLAVRPNADGSVYLAGRFTEIQGIPRSGLARLLGESPVRLLDVRPSGNGLQFRFETRKDRRYQVESIEAIPGSAWESMGEWFVGDGGSRTFLHPDQAGTARYFRVRTE